ncbi:hypothetical protein FA13DRAFT_1717920 [Coprinellus micaceus]|uniref:Uncharacterized protein n=1 Tax=Coprinellus micaceus TaxID=71717 RepID=A0A4Y7SF78_COPMI|nr:hypothetical protein FA13DRAFT_1717920 [Coprinellus micaceus]
MTCMESLGTQSTGAWGNFRLRSANRRSVWEQRNELANPVRMGRPLKAATRGVEVWANMGREAAMGSRGAIGIGRCRRPLFSTTTYFSDPLHSIEHQDLATHEWWSAERTADSSRPDPCLSGGEVEILKSLSDPIGTCLSSREPTTFKVPLNLPASPYRGGELGLAHQPTGADRTMGDGGYEGNEREYAEYMGRGASMRASKQALYDHMIKLATLRSRLSITNSPNPTLTSDAIA